MELYYVSYKINTDKYFRSKRTKENRLMGISSCAVCGKKKSRLFENQEVH